MIKFNLKVCLCSNFLNNDLNILETNFTFKCFKGVYKERYLYRKERLIKIPKIRNQSSLYRQASSPRVKRRKKALLILWVLLIRNTEEDFLLSLEDK